MEPDNGLSDADWKEVLLTIIDTSDSSMYPDALHQAVTDHCRKESGDAGKLIRSASDEGYLRTTRTWI
jgi:hypothetical protein